MVIILRRTFLSAVLALSTTLVRPAAAQTYTYNGPFSGTGSVNPWSTDNWIGGVPAPSATTQLTFTNYDTGSYTANNDLGNPFLLNGAFLNSFSQISTTVSNLSGNSLELTGANPFISLGGPGSFTFGTGATGSNNFVLSPTSGTTTIRGSGNGTLTLGSSTISITGTGGLTINLTGAGSVSLFGNNTFTGGVNLNAGTLYISSAGALGAGNTLTVNGGSIRTLVGATFSNPVVLNSDLNHLGGTMTINGPVSGAGGINVLNGTNFTSQNLTFGGALTFAGPLNIQSSISRAGGQSLNLATVTLGVGATLGSTQPITVGNNGTLVLAGNTLGGHILNANALVLNGGRVTLAGTSGGTTSETFGNVTASGLAVITNAANANSNVLAFGALTRQNNATLNFMGPINGSNNVVTFAGGLPTVSDPLAPATTGQYTGVIPFAAGNFTSAQANVNEFLTYNSTGVSFINPTDTAYVQQVNGAITAAASYKNVNLTGSSTTVNGTQRVNSLSSTATTTITGSGTLTVSSGAVLIGPASTVGNGIAINGPTLDFGAATGFIHLGGNGAIQGSSSITGSGGLVISGLDAPGSSQPGSGAGYTFQFSNTANPFTGGLTVNGNAGVNFTSDAQLGAANGAITFGGGGLTYNPATVGSVVINRPVTLGAAGGNIVANGSNSVEMAGTISGPGSLAVGSPYYTNTGGPVTLSGTNTYTGTTFVESGAVLRIASDANLGSTASPVNMQGGTLQFSASNTFAKGIVMAGGASFDTGVNSVTFAAPISGVVPAGFTKIGTGTLTLNVANPLFGGQVIVNAGTLALTATGTLPQVTTLTVNSGGTFAGNGFVGGTVKVNSGGTLSPGLNGAGQMTVGSNLTLLSGAMTLLELGGTAPGTGYDQELVGNNLTLGGTLTLSLINGLLPTLGEKFFVFDLTGSNSPTGTFANGTGTGGLVFTDGRGDTYQINYADRDPADTSNALSNDVSLTVIGLVPEPSTWMLLSLGALASVLGMARRGSRRAASTASVQKIDLTGAATAVPAPRVWTALALGGTAASSARLRRRLA